MEEEGTLKRTLSVESDDSALLNDDENENCSKKKARIMKEFPLNRHGSSADSQYIVMSQNNEEIDQASLEYSVNDFLSDDDEDGKEDSEDNKEDGKDEDVEAEDPEVSDTELDSNKTEAVEWDSESKGDNSTFILNSDNTLKYDSDNDPPTKNCGTEYSGTDIHDISDSESSTINGELDESIAAHVISNSVSSTLDVNVDDSVSMPGLAIIESVYKDAKLIEAIVSGNDFETIYEKLAENHSNPNRLDIVTTELLDEPVPDSMTSDDIFKDVKNVINQVKLKSKKPLSKSYILSLLRLNATKKNCVDIVIQQLLVSLQEADENENNAGSSTTTETDIFDDVQTLVSKFPQVSPDEIYGLLELQSSSNDRVQEVIHILEKKASNVDTKIPLERLESDPDNPLTKNDPIYQDMRVVAKMFPQKDRNEIYAYLEAHHNENDRIQIVIDELLKYSNDSQDVTDRGQTYPLLNRSRGEFENLCEVFPDCDPNYIFEQLEANAKDVDRMNTLAARMFESRNYPKLKEVLEKQSKFTDKKRIQNMKLNMKDFLHKFPDPVTFFENNDKAMSVGYKEHVLVQVKNDYPQLKDGFIKEVLNRNDHYLLKSMRDVNKELTNIAASGRHSKKLRTIDRIMKIPYPDVPDEFFFNELLYSRHEVKIKMYLKETEEYKKKRIEEARENRELYECVCCFDGEVLLEDMATCARGHTFCKVCVQRSTEAAFGQAKLKFPCLMGTCEHDIPLSLLQSVVQPNLFSNILRKLQEEEVRLADIPDLVSCPYCSFATVMPDPSDKVFKCLNTECLKETCRFCQEPNHVPLKCEEVEKKTETDMRTYIETKISEAMLRTCSNCKKRFFKDFGCNKMTCPCGTTMCYVCRESNIDYDHFNAGGGCANENDVKALHQKEMVRAAETARQQYLKDHPDATNIDLKYDPKKLVDDMTNRGPRFDDDDDEDDEYDEDEFDEDNY